MNRQNVFLAVQRSRHMFSKLSATFWIDSHRDRNDTRHLRYRDAGREITKQNCEPLWVSVDSIIFKETQFININLFSPAEKGITIHLKVLVCLIDLCHLMTKGVKLSNLVNWISVLFYDIIKQLSWKSHLYFYTRHFTITLSMRISSLIWLALVRKQSCCRNRRRKKIYRTFRCFSTNSFFLTW